MLLALAVRAADAPADVARRVLSDARYQRELPGPLPPPPDLSWLRWLAPFIKPLLYTLAAVSLALLVWWLIGLLRGWVVAPLDAEPTTGAADAGRSEPLDDPDRLAAAGEFGEATHLLLLLAIRHLASAAGIEPAKAATSRELAGLFRLRGEPREDFGALVRQVEDYLFGGQPVDGERYARCRTHWQRLVGSARA